MQCRWEFVLWPPGRCESCQHRRHLTEDLCSVSFSVWGFKCFCMVTYRRPFYNWVHTHQVWKSNRSSNQGPVLTFDPARDLAVTHPEFWESLVEGLMVIWSMLLNELTQPLTDVQCEGSAVSSDPWICIDYEWGSNNRTLSGVSQRINQKEPLWTQVEALCAAAAASLEGVVKHFREKKSSTIVFLKTPREGCGKWLNEKQTLVSCCWLCCCQNV